MISRATALRAWLFLICISLLVPSLCSCFRLVDHDHIIDSEIMERARNHLQQVYPEKDFVIDNAYYVFKDNCYRVKISSPSSRDSYFSLDFDLKTYDLIRDSYEADVLSGYNTRKRLVEEYCAVVEPALKQIEGLRLISADLCCYSEEEARGKYFSPQGLKTETLIFDYSYEIKNIGKEYGYIEISFSEESLSVERCLDRLMEVHIQLAEDGGDYFVISIELEHISSEKERESFGIYGITKEDLFCEDPLSRLQEMWTEQEAHRQTLKDKWEQNT